MFLFEAAPAIVMGGVVIYFMSDRISQARWLSDAERTMLAENIEHDENQKQHLSVRQLIKSYRLWIMGVVYFSMTMGLYGISFWLPTIIQGMGVADNFEIGMLSSIPWLAAVVAMLLCARSADLTNEKRWHVAVPMIFGAAGLVCSVLWMDSTVAALLALTVACMGIMSAIPLFWSLPTAFLLGSGAAMGIAAINSVANLAGFISPYLVGWLKQTTHSTDSGMYMLAAVLVVGALVTLSIPARLVNK
jgi:nitrate/nitrite transporter NarK